jgi:hypothetical protein
VRRACRIFLVGSAEARTGYEVVDHLGERVALVTSRGTRDRLPLPAALHTLIEVHEEAAELVLYQRDRVARRIPLSLSPTRTEPIRID